MGFWEINLQFLTILAEHRNEVFNWFFSAVTWLGAEYIVVAVLASYYLLIDKKKAYKLGCAFLFSATTVQFVKILCRIPRPWVLIKDHPVGGEYAPLDRLGSISKATGYSFPSAHAQSATSLYGFLTAESKKIGWKIAYILLAVLICFSRLYLGVHTPFDVVVAIIAAVIVLVFVEKTFDRLYDTKWHFVLPSLVGGISVIAAIVALDLYDVNWFGEEVKMCYDALKVAALGSSFSLSYFIERNFIHFDPKQGGKPRKVLRFCFAVGGALGFKELIKIFGKLIYGGETVGVIFFSHFVIIPIAMVLVPVIEGIIVEKYRKNK